MSGPLCGVGFHSWRKWETPVKGEKRTTQSRECACCGKITIRTVKGLD